ncbi:MAG: Ig domain-containing protein [Terriglobales bacterium]
MALAALAVAAPPVQASQQTVAFQIMTTYLPEPQAGVPYRAQLQAVGGEPPYSWSIVSGQLPEGVELDEATGAITGVAGSDASFAVLVEIRDAATPPLVETRLLPSGNAAPLAMSWKQKPQVSGQNITGSVEVQNQSGQTVELTVMAVAVNQVGKAFSLRYFHKQLHEKQATGELPFSVFLPPGTYTVEVDAVAAVSQNVIYRQRLEMPGLAIPN